MLRPSRAEACARCGDGVANQEKATKEMVEFALIAGANVLSHPPFQGAVTPETVETPYGAAEVFVGRGYALVLRHGRDGAIAPQMINHRANIAALKKLGVTACLSYCSVGSLRAEMGPGDLVVASDYINLAPILTYFEREPRFVAPTVSERLREALLASLAEVGERAHREGVYYQSIGPRLETKAEVKMLAQFADVVGMTWGHEATLCCELGIETACLCSIDNMAHGLDAADSSTLGDEINREKAKKAGRFGAIAESVIARLT